MSEQRGFWSERPREGGDDAHLLVAERIHDLRHVGYDELRRRADADTEVEQVSGPDGQRYERRTSVKRMSRGGEEELRIQVSVVRGGRLARLNPLAEELLVATPDGEMVGEYTLASEATTPAGINCRDAAHGNPDDTALGQVAEQQDRRVGCGPAAVPCGAARVGPGDETSRAVVL